MSNGCLFVELPLPSIPLFKAFFEHIPEGFVADKTPIATVVVAWRCLRGKSFYHNIGAQTTQNLHKKVEVLLQLPEAEMFGMFVVFSLHCGTPKYL